MVVFLQTRLTATPPDRASFQAVPRWAEAVRHERDDDVIIVIVGNKSELSEGRQISSEEGERLAQELNSMFIETSAKTGYNVKALFTRIAQALPGPGDSVGPNSDTTGTQRKPHSCMPPQSNLHPSH
jgi:Ras-related protein Rab-6A